MDVVPMLLTVNPSPNSPQNDSTMCCIVRLRLKNRRLANANSPQVIDSGSHLSDVSLGISCTQVSLGSMAFLSRRRMSREMCDKTIAVCLLLELQTGARSKVLPIRKWRNRKAAPCPFLALYL